MQSLYWVLTYACHRKCRHCYDDRFRPYVRDDLSNVVGEGSRAFEKIIENLPDDLTWADSSGERRPTLLVLAGGELLIDGVRDELFFPALDAIEAKYAERRPFIAIQTTGDVLTPERLDACLARGVRSFAIASIDDYHVGFEGDKKFAFMDEIRELMASRGVIETDLGGGRDERLKAPDAGRRLPKEGEATFLFFGAQPELWIGELWPRGRAWLNGLSKADYGTNFCARWSGGANFLKIGEAGSEVSIEPDGSVYPCCIKTKAPLGSLAEERLEDILQSVAALPAIRAIDRGDPEAMGLEAGWSRETFRARSAAEDGAGVVRENMCLGCDAYFKERLAAEIEALRGERLALRQL